ncbi:MAG: DUF1343 domain-containing protein [Anaerolineae bacterium]|nr:DUF1343 domain-containing protein [Anaerolineae bacterium]
MIQLGLEQFASDHEKYLRGRRVGLITHMAAVAPDFTLGLDLLLKHGVHITALFGPEHGLDGAGADATAIDDATDARTGLPVYSLYGMTQEPSAAMLEQVDVLAFDMQDIGARFYTFISTLDYIMQAAEHAGKEVIVLDRPNPITGVLLEGPLVAAGLESFISHLSVPVRHGYTTGEMARFIHRTKKMSAPLTVVPMRGWRRSMWWDETGLPWIPLSPGMPRFSTTIPYTGTCLLEGTNISEGRGTTMPFEILGAPWLDGYNLARDLNALDLPGVRFRPHVFVPMGAKFHNVRCGGVQVHVTDRNIFRPVAMGVHLLATLRAQNPERFEFLSTSWEGAPPHLDLLMGTPLVRQGILDRVPPAEIVSAWHGTTQTFQTARVPDLVYH